MTSENPITEEDEILTSEPTEGQIKRWADFYQKLRDENCKIVPREKRGNNLVRTVSILGLSAFLTVCAGKALYRAIKNPDEKASVRYEEVAEYMKSLPTTTFHGNLSEARRVFWADDPHFNSLDYWAQIELLAEFNGIKREDYGRNKNDLIVPFKQEYQKKR